MSAGTYISDIGSTRSLAGVWRYRDLLRHLVTRDIKVRYKRSILGFLWMLINPLVTMLVLWVVFHELFKSTYENYAVYLISGLLFFNFFASGSAAGLSSLVYSGGLIRKVAVPKVIFPLAAVVANLVNFLFSLVPLYLFLFLFDVPIARSLALLPVALVSGFLFTLGVSLVLATLNVFYRDVRWFYDSAIQVLQWATPIVYPIAILPERYHPFVWYNPIARLVDVFRVPLTQNQLIAPQELALVLGIGGLAILVGLAVFWRYEERFINYL
jgi:ABC-type polysaccharide/polyol phosphate export permease